MQSQASNITDSAVVDMTTRAVTVANQFSGVMRVMNTTANGLSVQGLECGSCWLSQDLTNAFAEQNGTRQFVVAVTNHHVVGGSRTVNCNYHFNNIPVLAYVVVTDHQNDIALLAMDVTDLQARAQGRFDVQDILMPASDVEFSPASTMKCQCVGFPFGRDGITVTSGVLGAYTMTGQKLNIVASIPVNPGNSGGCAVYKGGVMGTNTAVSTMGLNNETYITPVRYALALASMLRMPQLRQTLNAQYVQHFDAHAHTSGCLGFKECGTPLNTQEWLEKHAGVGDHVLYERLGSHTCSSEVDVTPCADCVAGRPTPNCAPSMTLRAFPTQWNKMHTWCPSGVFAAVNAQYKQAGFQSPYPAATRSGVFVTKVYKHEPALQAGDYIMGVRAPGNDISPIDSFGMIPNGRPYHTVIEFNPYQPVKLYVARKGEENVLEIEYTYTTVSLDKLPNVHSATLGPALQPIQIGGVMLQPLSTELATRFKHTKYLDEMANELVFVVVNVVPNTPEWMVLHVTPGSLCTKVNHVKFCEQPNLVGNTPKAAMETAMKNAFTDGYISLTFETRNMKTGKMREVCQMHLMKPQAAQTPNMGAMMQQFSECLHV
jgi:S1-C subfamily serine protease